MVVDCRDGGRLFQRDVSIKMFLTNSLKIDWGLIIVKQKEANEAQLLFANDSTVSIITWRQNQTY